MTAKTIRFFLLALMIFAAATSFAAQAETPETPAPSVKPVLEDFFPEGLLDADKQYVDPAALENKVFALYFSASWCRGCAAFSPTLVKMRNANSDRFEVVLVGFDNSADDMHDYMKRYAMLWPAVDWDSPVRLALKERFSVSLIPALIVVAPDGRIITTDGYQQIQNLGEEVLQTWLQSVQTPAGD